MSFQLYYLQAVFNFEPFQTKFGTQLSLSLEKSTPRLQGGHIPRDHIAISDVKTCVVEMKSYRSDALKFMVEQRNLSSSQ